MTIEEAITHFEDVARCNYKPTREAAELALDALRAQMEAGKNEPLTLEELLEMDGQPAFVVGEKGAGWTIVDWHGVNKSWMWAAEGMSAKVILYRDYGTRWLAYRRPPKEE